MNCPCHVQVFNQGLKQLPRPALRMAEFGSCHRNEPSGSLHGLMRVRNFVQDDAHIFCTDDQIRDEVLAFNALVFDVYGTSASMRSRSSCRRPEKRVGSDEVWDKRGEVPGRGARGGGNRLRSAAGGGRLLRPQDRILPDRLHRPGLAVRHVQVDFSMPDRLGASYIDEHGEKQVPVMLHRAILGSIERFIGVLLEHYAGNLPLWLAPVQAVIMNITDAQADYVLEVQRALQARGIRAEVDLRNEKIGYKIRSQTFDKVPYLIVVGDREVEDRKVAVRLRNGTDLGAMPIEELADRLCEEVAQRANISDN
jgi:threonyl-tRNA synthetase